MRWGTAFTIGRWRSGSELSIAVRYLHLADIPTGPAFVRYWGNSGQGWILACDGLSAFDPTATCAVERRDFPVGDKPTRQLSLQPVAIGAVVEVTKRLKPSVQRVTLVTRRACGLQRVVNAEQAPKRVMWKPTRTSQRGRLLSLGK